MAWDKDFWTFSDVSDWRRGERPMSGLFAILATSTQVVNVHRGAVLPAARFVVIAVPCMALIFYLLVVRRHRDP